MDLIKLSYFHSAAAFSNFTKAAQSCHIAQTAMSRHIADIENEIGVELFKRLPKKVVLTPAGELFYSETKEILKKYNDVVSTVQDTAYGWDDRLNIAFGFFERSLLTEYIAPFVQKYPRISITIQQHPYDILMQELQKRNCDVVFCPPNWATIREKYTAVALRPSINHIVLSELHPLTVYSELDAEHIDGQVMIVPANDKPLEAFKRLSDHFNFKPKKLIAANTLEAMISMVETNIGIALVPSYIITNNPSIRFLPFKHTLLDDKRHVALSLKPTFKPAVMI